MTPKPVRILGVDPGSRLTGFGCVETAGRGLRLLGHGTLRLGAGGADGTPLDLRLLGLYRGLKEVIRLHQPGILVVENVFFAKNAVSALKLGQARGVVLLAGAIHGMKVFDYSATEVKKAITGYGQADKGQVAKVLQMLLGSQGFDTPDASDGLALAVYHAHSMATGDFDPAPGRAAAKRPRHRSIADAVKHRVKA